MSSSTKKVHQIADILFAGADILDYAGPIEMLSHMMYNHDMSAPEWVFKVHLIASTPTVFTGGVMTVSADVTFEEATERVKDFDILAVPGGMLPLLAGMAKNGSPEVEFIEAFNNAAQGQREESDERIILSVCTGALLVAATGALKGLKATTHHTALEMLKEIDGSIDVVSSVGDGGVGRYVDEGRNEKGVRMITAGGVTCGLDAGLYVAELKAGREAAEFGAQMNEYEWKRA